MTLTGLAVRNLARNKFRVVLTVAGVAVAILAFLLLRTVTWAWTNGANWAAKDRVVTRHKVTFVMSLPKRYVEEVRQAPHVQLATWANWFGAKDPKHDREFFSTLGADPATYFEVYDEMKVPSDQMAAWKHDRQGAIVGDVLAKKLGWKVGDRVNLESGIYPGDWQFTIDGIYTTTAKSVDRSTFIFQWDYLNDSLPPARRDMVGWIVSRIDDPTRVADVGVTLDKRFDDRDTPTLSQDERSFQASFMAMFSAVIKAMNIVSGVILVIMTLILGNTIAMGARERASEYGVLRAIGFVPAHVVMWILGEALLMGALGGLVGLAVAWPFINLGIGRFIEENLGSMFPYFRLEPSNMVLAVAMAALLGTAAAAIPAWRASKLRVIDAVRRVA
ncbi:MAG TPA: FtsX-like permease family protein [Polyangiaceae bacterium]|nr:FtsX-like permease family protein [Polyangiaceae bacterium]